ncbi:MAG: hypothetical protein QOG55_525, partial [Acidobacteriaceae bacterium]|nr:hypothetical protein [Acidobacteriaceae bacterium]
MKHSHQDKSQKVSPHKEQNSWQQM